MTLHVIQHAHQCDKDFSHELLCVRACTLMWQKISRELSCMSQCTLIENYDQTIIKL
jgi:hypothetical protein